MNTATTGHYYVVMKDRFMSGWGHAKGKTSLFIIECDTLDEAMIVEENGHDRSEMDVIGVYVDTYPRNYDNALHYHTVVRGKADCARWFVCGAFR